MDLDLDYADGPAAARRYLAVHAVSDLADIAAERIRLDRLVSDLGRDLALAGTSYAVIGEALGITRQSARERFAPLADGWRSDHPNGEMPWDTTDSGGDAGEATPSGCGFPGCPLNGLRVLTAEHRCRVCGGDLLPADLLAAVTA